VLAEKCHGDVNEIIEQANADPVCFFFIFNLVKKSSLKRFQLKNSRFLPKLIFYKNINFIFRHFQLYHARLALYQ
jgi:hypothetical protein